MATLLGKGTTLKLGSDVVGNVVSIDGPKQSMRTKETTNLSSTAATFRPTLYEAGEINISLQFDPDDDQHTAIQDLMTADPPAAATWTLTFTDATPTTFTFSAIATNFEIHPAASVDDLTMADLALKISGSITVA